MTNYMNRWIKIKFKELRKKFGGKCQRCEGRRKLQFAHKIHIGLNGKGRGRKERYYDILKHPDQYMLLCRDCHLLYDKLMKYEAQKTI